MDNHFEIAFLSCFGLYASGKMIYKAIHRAYLAEELTVTGTHIPWTTDIGNTIMGTLGIFGVIVSDSFSTCITKLKKFF